MIMRRLRRGGQRGSVTIELALVTALFLLPLTVGSVDMLFVLTQRFQMHRALQSLYFYAWANPNNANNSDAPIANSIAATARRARPNCRTGPPS